MSFIEVERMSYKFPLKVLLVGVGMLGALTTAATAQGAEPPECYLIDNSGKLTDLTSICNASQQRTAVSQPLQLDDNPECFLIDNSGNLTDLTDLCNVSQKQAASKDFAGSEPMNVDNNIAVDDRLTIDNNQFILGENNVVDQPGAINSAYYIDNAIGGDYAAYVRQYQNTPTSLTRQTLREEVFQLNTNVSTSDRLTSILRDGREVPFLIYRY